MARSDREIIKAWQRQDAREDDEADEGRIGLGPPPHVATTVKCKQRCSAAAMALAGMANLSGGIVDLSGNSSVNSDVEEIVKWDRDLRATKTFSMVVMILSGCKYDSPKLDVQQKNLLYFIDQPAIKYFRLGSPQVMAFKELKNLCYAGWKTETSRKKKWTISFVAETLALLLVLHSQTEKEKEQWENELAAQSALAKSTKSRTPKATALKRGTPKATALKCASWKLWNTYQPC
jgi:hypothetical protein